MARQDRNCAALDCEARLFESFSPPLECRKKNRLPKNNLERRRERHAYIAGCGDDCLRDGHMRWGVLRLHPRPCAVGMVGGIDIWC
jgi:hypothetical protein